VDLNQRNRQHCVYMLGLGSLGLGEAIAAHDHFEAALALDISHLGVSLHRRMSLDSF